MDINLDYFSTTHWDRVAAARGYTTSDVGDALMDSVVGVVSVVDPSAVLDVGSGNGALARALAAGCPSAVVTGVDCSAVAVQLAESRLAVDGIDQQRVAFVTGSATELPFEDSSFDAITMLKTAWVLPDLSAALIECRRVLRPRGRVAIQTWAVPEECTALLLGSEVIAGRVGGFVLPPDATAPFELTTGQIATQLSEAGFSIEDQPRFSWPMAVRSAQQYWDQLRSIAGTAFWALRVQPGPDRVQLDADWLERSAEFSDHHGWVRLELAWHVTVGTAR